MVHALPPKSIVDVDRAVREVCARCAACSPTVFAAALTLALEIAREGQEGRAVGTLFTVGRPEDVLPASRALILDPLTGHVPSRTHITDPQLRGTVKQLAQLDGAFVVGHDGTVIAACRYVDLPTDKVTLPLGLGSRHLAAAAVSRLPDTAAIVVSTTGLVRVFVDGAIVATLSG
jgi:DNA integrity scanning protein DisA with diadenylate cyclase activity